MTDFSHLVTDFLVTIYYFYCSEKWGKQALVDGLCAHTNGDNFGTLCAL